ncbi:MAG: MarR family transcriptional regulator [Quinella sp. 3Q1]|nr:MarR family transcriptional regulator [Quinella sp. 3Q1]MBR6888771.1 MarR family transcriptional regulator [Selenomonadaceae bacterium]
MNEKKDLANTFLETHHLLRRYNMLWYGKNFGGLDPRQGQGRILMALQRMKSATQKELGFILDIRPQSLGELLQKLENNGYIQRRRSDTDRRILIVELTAKGEIFQLRKPDYSELFIYLTAEEKRFLKSSLEKISEQLEEMMERENDEEFY